MKTRFLLLSIVAMAIAAAANAGEPMAPNPPASPVPLPYGCAQKSSSLPDLHSPDFGCSVMRQALSQDDMSQFDQAAFLSGMQIRQNALILFELRQIRERLDSSKGGAK
jgi:hypothetical protein